MRIRDPNMLESETLKYSIKPKLPHGARQDVPRLIGVHEAQRKANVARNLPRRHFKSAATHSLGRQQRVTQTESGRWHEWYPLYIIKQRLKVCIYIKMIFFGGVPFFAFLGPQNI